MKIHTLLQDGYKVQTTEVTAWEKGLCRWEGACIWILMVFGELFPSLLSKVMLELGFEEEYEFAK